MGGIILAAYSVILTFYCFFLLIRSRSDKNKEAYMEMKIIRLASEIKRAGEDQNRMIEVIKSNNKTITTLYVELEKIKNLDDHSIYDRHEDHGITPLKH